MTEVSQVLPITWLAHAERTNIKRHAPEMTKISRVLLSMACTRGKNQHERSHGIAITGNFQATSKRIPRDFHNSSLVSSCLLESPQRPEKAMQNLSQGRLQRFRNRLKIGRGTISNQPGAPNNVPGASWGALRVPWKCPESLQRGPGPPERAARSTWERVEAT